MPRPPRLPQGGPSIFDDIPPPDAAQPVRTLVVEADGGSRGNPGPAAYGALVRDADGTVLDSEARTLGVATNNVAEYSGLVAGLEMARTIDQTAAVEVRMDSRLVIEQMAGRWKTKHADLKPLAQRAASLCAAEMTWTWVPRAENSAADGLVNAALDGRPQPRRNS
jgi:probable phosphoglycerate mutase